MESSNKVGCLDNQFGSAGSVSEKITKEQLKKVFQFITSYITGKESLPVMKFHSKKFLGQPKKQPKSVRT